MARSCWPQDVNHLVLMTSKFPSAKCLWLGARAHYRVRVSDRESKGQRGLREGGISATLIDRYLFPSPLAWKNTRSSMSTEINKRKPPNRSSPPLWFSRGLAVTFPQDKVVMKVTLLFSPSLSGKRRVGGVESGWVNLFSDVLHPPPNLQRGPGEDWQSHNSGLMRSRLSAWPFLKCIRGSKDGTFPRSMQR